ncbi:hypothetical protein C8F01DRAFT_1360447 [Mycena amicta]|nr:hypothetical protein C8F01DRAFT_1360447 [Mycena amicta]
MLAPLLATLIAISLAILFLLRFHFREPDFPLLDSQYPTSTKNSNPAPLDMQFNILFAFIVASMTFSHVQAATVRVVTDGTTTAAAPAVNGTTTLALASVNGTTTGTAASAPTAAVKRNSLESRSGAGNTCNDWEIAGHKVVQASCQVRGNIGSRTSVVEFGACITNNDGRLSCKPGGLADRSCIFGSIMQSTSNRAVVTVQAVCTRVNGGEFINNGFDIGACFSNSDGDLVC